MVHRIALAGRRRAEALDFWAERLDAARASRPSATGDSLRFADPEGLGHELRVVDVDDEPLIAEHPEIPAELALQGFDGVRAYSSDPEASRPLLEEALGFEPAGDGRLGGPRRAAAAASTATTSRPPSAACRAPAASTTSPGPRRWTSTRPGASA